MTFVPVMWSVWGALVVLLAAIWVYRSRLERDEEDQIFLDDSFAQERAAQAAIVAKVEKVQPVFRGAMIVVGIATLGVVGYYVYDIFFNQLR